MHHSKKIAVFVSHIYGSYQKKLLNGIVEQASSYGYFTEVFTTNDGEDLGEYSIGEQSIIRIPASDNYIGVIFASGTYLLDSLRTQITNLLKEHYHCPVIDVGQKRSDFPCIYLENNKPFSEVVAHLYKEHHFKRICYLGNTAGEVEISYNQYRKSAYLAGIKACGLICLEHDIYDGDYSIESLEAAFSFFSQEGTPDAIICFNDQIALSLMELLTKKGIQIPAEIAITGCDCLESGQEIEPTLTSISFPIEQMGQAAVKMIFDSLHGHGPQAVNMVEATLSIGTSCGCPLPKSPVMNHKLYSYTLNNRISRLESHLIDTIRTSAVLQEVNDIDEGIESLYQSVKDMPDITELYLCLYENWDHVSEQIHDFTLSDDEIDSDSVLLKFAIRNGKRLPECTFTRLHTLPDYLYENQKCYVYTPLFFGKREFGYLALATKEDVFGYPFPFLTWIMNVNSMLYQICTKKKLGFLMEHLEDIYTKDELTGLYNRQGYNITSAPLLEQAIETATPVTAILYDLDCLKLINDNFGHAEGNFAIQVLAHALESSVEAGTICARIGGDEFQILAFDHTESQILKLTKKIEKYLDNYNVLHTKRYIIQASHGCCTRTINSVEEISSLFDDADASMYQQKKNKNKNILKP